MDGDIVAGVTGECDEIVGQWKCSSLPSSLEPSSILRETGLCTRACLRMLLRTLKQRPQPSNEHVNATIKNLVRNAFAPVKSLPTFIACVGVQVYLTKLISCRPGAGHIR